MNHNTREKRVVSPNMRERREILRERDRGGGKREEGEGDRKRKRERDRRESERGGQKGERQSAPASPLLDRRSPEAPAGRGGLILRFQKTNWNDMINLF